MLNTRRRLVHALTLAGIGVLPWRVQAQATYPRGPIRLVVGFAAGGSLDVFARLIATKLSERLGQPVIVDNRPGAGGLVAAEFVARAPADGYTLLIADVGPNAIAPSLYPKMGYNVITSFVPISYAIDIPYVLVVNSSLKAQTLSELIAYGKANPGVLNYASSGNGGMAHLAGELLKIQGGFDITHVPYKGGAPGVAAVVSGEVQMMFVTIPTALPHVGSGKVRAIAVGGKTRSSLMPQVPTMRESGLPNFTAGSWSGLLAPTGTPPDVIARLSREMTAILGEKEMREKLVAFGYEVVAGSAEDFSGLIREESRKWGEVVQLSGAKGE